MWCHCRHWKPRVRPHWEKQQLPPKQLQVPSALEGSLPSWTIVFYFISTCQNVQEKTESRHELDDPAVLYLYSMHLYMCVSYRVSGLWSPGHQCQGHVSPVGTRLLGSSGSWNGKGRPAGSKVGICKARASVARRNARQATGITYFPFLQTQILHS